MSTVQNCDLMQIAYYLALNNMFLWILGGREDSISEYLFSEGLR